MHLPAVPPQRGAKLGVHVSQQDGCMHHLPQGLGAAQVCAAAAQAAGQQQYEGGGHVAKQCAGPQSHWQRLALQQLARLLLLLLLTCLAILLHPGPEGMQQRRVLQVQEAGGLHLGMGVPVQVLAPQCSAPCANA
jgi:hypothetical protein